MKKAYSKPLVTAHEIIIFETLLSCNLPNHPGQDEVTGAPVCLRPDNTWFPR